METIFRRKKRQNRFSIISNDPIQDARISWKARGILIYMLSLPDDWEVHLSEIAKHSEKDGRDSFASGIKELEVFGYLQRIQEKDEKGKFLPMVYEISEIAELGKEKTPSKPLPEHVEPQTGFPSTGEPQTGEPLTGNPPLQNTDYTNTDFYKDLDNKTRVLVDKEFSKYPDIGFHRFWLIYEKKSEKPNAWKEWKKIKDPAIHEEIIKGATAWKNLWSQFTKAEQTYIPYPERFIKNEKWNAEALETDLKPLLARRKVPNAAEGKKTAEIIEANRKIEKKEERAREDEKAYNERVLRWYHAAPESVRTTIDNAVANNPMVTRLKVPVQKENENSSEREFREQQLRSIAHATSIMRLTIAKSFYEEALHDAEV